MAARTRKAMVVATAAMVATACLIGLALGFWPSDQTGYGNSDPQQDRVRLSFSVRYQSEKGDSTSVRVWVGTGAGKILRARTVSNNHFEIDSPKVGQLVALADAKDNEGAWLLSTPVKIDGSVSRHYELVLTPTATLTVEVVSAVGEPVPEAQINLRYPETLHFMVLSTFGPYIFDRTFGGSLVADSAGITTLHALPIGTTVYVSASSSNRRSELREVLLTSKQTITLSLERVSGQFSARVVDADGTPRSRFPVLFKTADKSGNVTEIGTAISDGNGELFLPLDTDEIVRFEPGDSDFQIVSPYRYYSAENSGCQLTIFKPFTFRVQASYPDGSPCLGQVDVVSWAGRRQFLPSRLMSSVKSGSPLADKSRFNLDGTVTVTGYPRVSAAEIHVRPDKEGYMWTCVGSDLTKLKDSAIVEVVVSVDDRPKRTGVIRITPGQALSKPIHVTVVSMKSGYAFCSKQITASFEARVPFGEYVVTATSDETAWESPVVTVSPNDNPDLEVPAKLGGSIRLRVKDGNGNAIDGAVMEIDNLEAPDFPEVEEAGVRATSNASGEVVLGGQPAGWRKYRVEAWQFQPVVIDLYVISGDMVDFGTVVLHAAVGRLTVVFKEAVPGDILVRADLEPTYNRSRRPSEDVELQGGTITYAALVTGRSYALVLTTWCVVRLADGTTRETREGILYVRDIVLPEHAPVQELRLSLSDFKPLN